MHLALLAVVLAASLSTSKLRKPQRSTNPQDGKVLFGAWVDSEDPRIAAATGLNGVGGDSPLLFNRRLGNNAAVFHKSQTLPLGISAFDNTEMTANLTLLEETNTDAIFMLTVKLAIQLDNISNPSKSGRRVMLRFAPEMNGKLVCLWEQAGTFCSRFEKKIINHLGNLTHFFFFLPEYRRIADAIRAVTNRVSFVWAPNAANLYPFGSVLPDAEVSTLDTNKNGVVDFEDDPFTPYWPGDDYVDWVGISMYWKGNPNVSTPPRDNSVCPPDYWEQMVQGGGTSGANPKFPFYDMFAKGHNKPLVMPEGGAAFALTQGSSSTPLPVGAGQVNIAQTFWRSYLNTRFFAKYPKAKMFINFEYIKAQEDPVYGQANGVTRDYRITWDPSTVAALKTDLAALGSAIQWAVPFVPGQDPLSIGGGQSNPNGGTVRPTTGGGGGTSAPATTKSSSVGSVTRGVLSSVVLSIVIGFALA
ncbi:glycoside hydrolase superfamily [Obelidium mucronatum]|nr:glycoside hydrolase superfamily [Obelidium mucronatum]